MIIRWLDICIKPYKSRLKSIVTFKSKISYLYKRIMYKQQHILDYFPSYIFWDAQAKKLDIEANSQYIIEKVMMSCADQSDFNNAVTKLEKFYSKDRMKHTISDSKEFISKMKYYAKKRYELVSEHV